MLKFSVFTGGETDTTPSTRESSAFVDVVTAALETNWSPFVFSGRRVVDNFLTSDLLVFDIDSGMTLAEAEEQLISLGVAYALLPTRNHQKEKKGQPPCDRYRVLIPLNKTITDYQTYRATRAHYGSRYFPSFDKASTDCFFYVSSDISGILVEGKGLDPIAAPIQRAAPIRSTALPDNTAARVARLSRRTAAFFLHGAENGHWNHELYQAARDCLQHGIDEIECINMAERIEGYLDANSKRTIGSAYSKPPSFAPREPFGGDDDDEERASAADLAEAFLISKGLIGQVRYWQSDFYIWRENHYVPMNSEEMLTDIIAWMQADEVLRRRAGSRMGNDILSNLKAIAAIPSTTIVPSWVGRRDSATNLVPMANGILDIDKLLAGAHPMEPHHPDFFSFTCLPYAYDPAATAPTWMAFLEQCQPDQEVRDLIQEWFGYNLIFDTKMAKFMLFEGQGANGKSVCCTVLRAVLGEENVSAVGLEAMDPRRTFTLAATAGKLANIVEELNEIDKACEGMLKQYVTGGVFTVERKHRDPFTLVPTARLTFATNILPRFTDRTDGLWRRLLHVPFRIQILDENKQDKRLISPAFWTDSGELPGIFNWAVEGLRRLRRRGRFQEPKASTEAKQQYQADMNPARTWLLDHYSMGTSEDVVLKTDVYSEYNKATRDGGQYALSAPQFDKEVRRAFPTVYAGENPIRVGGKRGRAWYGLKLRADAIMESGAAGLLKTKTFGGKK